MTLSFQSACAKQLRCQKLGRHLFIPVATPIASIISGSTLINTHLVLESFALQLKNEVTSWSSPIWGGSYWLEL